MKVRLVVSQGPHEGKEIPIKVPEFVIGRDPQCQLRPASPMISRRHCALFMRDGKVFLRDFGSTNGTHVNEKRVEGELELHHQDHIKIDPLFFQIRIDQPAPVLNSAATVQADLAEDESIAAMLLDIKDSDVPSSAAGTGTNDVPMGTTVMQVPVAPLETETPEEKRAATKKEAKKPELGNTASAAKLLLEKYTRRKRP
jgi:pSer/pThr/pTyr-binding forkhead associated (FHA) protein